MFELKNRLYKVLQVTFPELENLLSTPTGEQYWNLVMAFPCKEFVLSLSQSNLCKIIHQSTSKRISENLTDKLVELANRSYCAVKKTSPMMEEVRYYAQELLRLSERRQVVLNDMVALVQPLPEYDILRSIPGIAETTATSIIGELEDIRRFQSINQINDFIGIVLRHYESGTFSPRNTSLSVGILMQEKFCTSAFITSLQLVILIPAISLTFMRNEKDNR